VTDLFRLLRRERFNFPNLQLQHPTQPLVETLRAALDRIEAADLCVGADRAERLRGRSGVGYQEIFSGPDMTVCVFILRAGTVIPLHNHPDMHVFGRLLFGRMRVLSYDPDEPDISHSNGVQSETPGRDPPSLERQSDDSSLLRFPPGSRHASLRSDEVLGPDPVTYGLSPEEGNVHEIHALENCAFFDVLTPPYNIMAGRDCTYFVRQEEDADGRCILVPTPMPHFGTESVAYRGPSFFE
jgi:cysteamine dioxygenase